MKIHENEKMKVISSEDYNLIFDKESGFTARWGKTKKDDPEYCKFGPEIADIEISTICNGLGKPCSWCYKSNTGCGTNMTLETFRKVCDNLPNTVTQIAFGIGDIHGNPELFDIMLYSRDKGIIPNITINGWRFDEETANKLASVAGAVAVSHYGNDSICFDSIQRLGENGLKQVNIHKLLSKETLSQCYDLIDKAKTDERLKKHLNAIVFLLLKPKGLRNHFHGIDNQQDYTDLINYAFKNDIRFGFDSCSAGKFMEAIKGDPREEQLLQVCEPCESGLFSMYVDVSGEFFPCSFMEGEEKWETGISMIQKDFDFDKDLWHCDRVTEWRANLLKCRSCGNFNCPHFDT